MYDLMKVMGIMDTMRATMQTVKDLFVKHSDVTQDTGDATPWDPMRNIVYDTPELDLWHYTHRGRDRYLHTDNRIRRSIQVDRNDRNDGKAELRDQMNQSIYGLAFHYDVDNVHRGHRRG